jgi:hypothetical protein
MGLSPAAILYDASGNPISIINDSGTYRISGVTKVLNAGGGQVNPATEDTLATRASEATLATRASEATLGTRGSEATLATRASETTLQSIDGKDFATETTLATCATAAAQTDGSQKGQVVDSTGDGLEIDASGRAAIQNQPSMDVALSTRATEATLLQADGRLTTIDSVLDLIKDTDGIKKITDPLPAGSNNIGDVDVVSSALPAGAATEATLLQADGRLTTIDAVLDSIKDTDGIKKITDQLPAGTNEIGKVAQGTKAAAADAWPEYLVDSAGNVVGVVLDDALYRLQADAKVAKDSSGLVHFEALDVSSGIGRLKATLYTQGGDPVSFPSTSASIKNDFSKNGTATSLLVDGSTTPVTFEYLADPTHDISLQEIKFTLASNSITFGSDYFGATSGPLTNGLLVQVACSEGTIDLYNLVQNESFVNFSSPGGFLWVVSNKDMMTSAYVIGGGLVLRAGTSDKVIVTVRDNLSSAGVYFKCYVKGNLAAA